jgi:hypothetical protein
MTRLLLILFFGALSVLPAPNASAQTDGGRDNDSTPPMWVPRFAQLPAEIRAQILTGTPRTSSQIADSPFGIHTTILQEGGDSEMIDKMTSLASDAGFKWVVEYVAVGSTPPNEVEAKFSQLPDRCFEYARKLQAAHITLLVRLDVLRWKPDGKTAPFNYEPGSPDMVKAQTFARLMVRQLKPYTHHWQIWNEPNIGNSSPYVTPENYVKLLEQVVPIIRKEQPDAVIYGPGTAMLQCLSDSPYPWITQALKAGLLKQIDVFSFHPYRQPATRNNLPENASQFAPWTTWKDYKSQITDLRAKIRQANGGKDKPLAATEDGLPNLINGEGVQEITWVVAAKYELRRALLDFQLGIHPRTVFALYRKIPDPYYNEQSSYSIVTADYEKKPQYYAAQNLNAVLDSSYERADDITVKITVSSKTPLKGDLQTQVYRKDHGKFEELLVFYWSAEQSEDLGSKYNASMEIGQPGWQGPLLIDLMAMPVRRPQSAPVEIIDSKFIDRRDPAQLTARNTPNSVTLERIEIRDYPQLIKWVRLKK